MERARFLVDAVVVGGQSPNQLARSHPISRSWLFELLRRFREGGHLAIESHSLRPHSCSHQVGPEVQAAVVALRAELSAAGDDAGPQSIAHHRADRVEQVPSVTTIWQILKRNRLITPQPHKRPRASFIRFEAQLPMRCGSATPPPWQLADAARSRS